VEKKWPDLIIGEVFIESIKEICAVDRSHLDRMPHRLR